jgi:hypothetical protein
MGASNAAANNESSILQGLSPQLGQLVSQWLTQSAPQLQSLVSGQSAAQPGYAQGATGAASGLTNLAGLLTNFNALSQPEISALSSQAGNTVSSLAKTIAAQNGATANPALVAQQATQQAGQTTANEASQLGSIAAQQKLGALEGAGSALSGAGGIYSGLNSQSLSSILNALGIGESALGTGVSGQLGVASGYQGLQQLANQSSPWSQIGSLLGGVGGLAGLFAGGGLGAGLGGSTAPQYGGGGGGPVIPQNLSAP